MRTVFSRISLKHIVSLFSIGTCCLLLLVLIFAGRQFLLYRHCEKLVDSSQQLLFQFTGIKEHISTSLINKKNLHSRAIIREIQELNTRLLAILDDILIPEEYKFSLISQLDLMNITVSLRTFQNDSPRDSQKEIARLSEQLRIIQDKLSSFQQLISRYTQKLLLSLQQALLGLLFIGIALVSIMMFLINKYISSPVLQYCKMQFPDEKDNISLFSLHKSIENLARGQNSKEENTSNITPDDNAMSCLYRYSSVGHLFGELSHELRNLSNGTINYSQAILDLSSDMQLDEDFRQLLQKLFTEEKRMASLLTLLANFSAASKTGTGRSLSLDTFFKEISHLLSGIFKKENITLNINLTEPERMLHDHVGDLQLVTLSVLQNARIALNSKLGHSKSGIKVITATVTINNHDESQKMLLISIQDNGEPTTCTVKNAENCLPPHQRTQLSRSFLKSFAGSLELSHGQDGINICTISLPLPSK